MSVLSFDKSTNEDLYNPMQIKTSHRTHVVQVWLIKMKCNSCFSEFYCRLLNHGNGQLSNIPKEIFYINYVWWMRY